ncbi:MAG TPA: class I SAM-dependent methyltransferase [Gammaproteobacteria bacterium]
MRDSYDEVPYQSIPFTDTQPENLAAIGRLFGLDTPDPGHARILELGCASGGNLLPLAAYLPEGRYLGIELSARQVRDGRRLIAALGLDNIRIEQGDILELDDTLGEFDYIVTHGVYSWVPPEVQTRILELCARHLAPRGVAYISYNTWPGWHTRWVLREMLLRYTRDAGSPGDRLARAQQLLREFPEALAHSDALPAQYLQGEIVRLREAHPSYLYHEYLERFNQPQYVSEFIATTERHGLQYVCDADLKSMFPSVLGEPAEHWLAQFDELAEQEQYVDFLVNRSFRQSLLCRADAPLDREIDLERLERMAFFALLRAPEHLDLSGTDAQIFSSGDGKDYSVGHPLTKAALVILKERYPAALPFAELVASATKQVHAAGNGEAAVATGALLTELFLLFTHQAIGMTPLTRSLSNSVGQRPCAHALARAQAAAGIGHLATARHSTILLDPFTTRLVDCLDGSRSVTELVAQLSDDLHAGRIVLAGLGPATPTQLSEQVEANVRRCLRLFAQQGILLPG